MTAQPGGEGFVVRSGGTWQVTPLLGRRPSEVSIDSILELIRTSQVAPDLPPGRPVTTPLAPDVDVVPAWSLVGAVTAKGLLVEDAEGHLLALDEADLRVLDTLTGPTLAAELAQRLSIDETCRRLGRLAVAGMVRVASAEPTPRAFDGQAPPQPQRAVVEPSGTPRPGGATGRIPVYAIWPETIGPLLSLGMLTAAARRHDRGVLNHVYEIRRPETTDSFLTDLASRAGPAVLLCSDYVWSLTENLEAAHEALSINPDLFVVHGGPSSPKYAEDAERFLCQHGAIAHVLTRGEGEHLIGELLTALAPQLPGYDPDTLTAIEGLTFRHSRTGQIVRTPDRARITDLDALASPYLTGEFDHIPADAWWYGMSVETNRGCPYGCTFCDWGSATLSRIRKFDLDRVTGEIQWAAEHGVHAVTITDANFGIMSRDVQIAERIAEVNRLHGGPGSIAVSPAKNTTKHLGRIMDTFLEAGIVPTMSISLQTTDPTTLEAVDRSNISTDHYIALAADHRRRGHPLVGDVMVGIPGQTYESYRNDLQFMLDHEILARTWPVQLLPNSPMNDPAYRARFGIETDPRNTVISTSTFSAADRKRMFRLRTVFVTTEVFGLLRHVLRWLQWDHDIGAAEVMDHLVDVTDEAPDRFPHLTWIANYFDQYPTAPTGWATVYSEVRVLLREDYRIEASSTLDTVLTLQHFLMPASGRRLPATITIPHDYPAYYRDATASLYTTGHAGTPERPLHTYGPADFTITGDPLRLCDEGPVLHGDSRDEVVQGDFYMASTSAYELLSPLVRLLPHVIRHLTPHEVNAAIPESAASGNRPDQDDHGRPSLVIHRRHA